MRDDRETDLFGNPVRANLGRRGRPPLQITPEDRDMVEAALVRGWGNERIAKAVGISPASLKRYFRATLAQRDSARDRMQLALMSRLARQASEGNVGAIKQLRDILAQDELRDLDRKMKQMQDEADEAGTSLGKKEIAQMRAAKAIDGGDAWGDLLDPQRIN